MAKPTYDLYDLNETVLQLKNDDFYEFVTEVAGESEANILKIQGIQSVRSLIRSNDLLDVFKLDCQELCDLKKRGAAEFLPNRIQNSVLCMHLQTETVPVSPRYCFDNSLVSRDIILT